MLSLNKLFLLFLFIFKVSGYSSGPFILWGVDKLKSIRLSALESVNDQSLRDIYSDSEAILMFVRNNSGKLDKHEYPMLKETLDKSDWAYLPQSWLPSYPLDYNVNVEVIHLTGSSSKQDSDITTLYHNAILNYNKGKVLGIIATQEQEHSIQKREETESFSSSSTTTNSPNTPESSNPSPAAAQPPEENITNSDCNNCTYYKEGKAILHTYSAPVLEIRTLSNRGTNRTEWTTQTINLTTYNKLTYYDVRENLNYDTLIVKFLINKEKMTLRFRFPLAYGYWSLNMVEIERERLPVENLTVDGEAPTAPIGFSYYCSKKITFSNENQTLILKLENIQVQARMNGAKSFGDAFDCIGFTTAPIWSGLFVSFIMLLGASIAICAILDIKPPNRFENNRNKQLTFTIQE